MEFEFRVDIIRKSGILDPEGDVIKNGLNQGLGLSEIVRVRADKFFRLTIDAPSRREAFKIAEDGAKRLLANPVYQEYRISPKTPPKRKHNK